MLLLPKAARVAHPSQPEQQGAPPSHLPPPSGLAAVIELLGEPFYILATVNLQFQLRVVMDTVPLALKVGGAFTTGLLPLAASSPGLRARGGGLYPS